MQTPPAAMAGRRRRKARKPALKPATGPSAPSEEAEPEELHGTARTAAADFRQAAAAAGA